LCDEPTNFRLKHGGDQVLGSLAAHAGISLRSCGHLLGIETRRQISQLVDHDIRTSLQYCR